MSHRGAEVHAVPWMWEEHRLNVDFNLASQDICLTLTFSSMFVLAVNFKALRL